MPPSLTVMSWAWSTTEWLALSHLSPWGKCRPDFATRRWLLKDEHGCLTKEKARACIDGSIFYQLAAENEQRKVCHASAELMISASQIPPIDAAEVRVNAARLLYSVVFDLCPSTRCRNQPMLYSIGDAEQ